MELLNRYLQAVGEYLPAKSKDDTLAELRANLLETMDDRAEELGRPLTDAEVSDVLKAHGRPEVVAVRYLPQRWLIGPAVFPFYWITLKRALPIVLLVYTIVRGALFALLPGTTNNVGLAIVQYFLQLIPVVWTFLSIVTAVFVALEYGKKNFGVAAQEWDPAKLPTVEPSTRKPSRTARVTDAIAHCLGIAYVVAVPQMPFLILGPGVFYLSVMRVAAAPVWHQIYLWVVSVMLVQLVLKLLNTGREPKRMLDIAVKTLSIALFSAVAYVRVYFVTLPGGMNVDVPNYWLNISFRIVVVVCLMDLAWTIWQASRERIKLPNGRFSLV